MAYPYFSPYGIISNTTYILLYIGRGYEYSRTELYNVCSWNKAPSGGLDSPSGWLRFRVNLFSGFIPVRIWAVAKWSQQKNSPPSSPPSRSKSKGELTVPSMHLILSRWKLVLHREQSVRSFCFWRVYSDFVELETRPPITSWYSQDGFIIVVVVVEHQFFNVALNWSYGGDDHVLRGTYPHENLEYEAWSTR